ncbi:MAG TPA: HAD family phosphatase, partial [Lactococcus sp.]|nr:HAD family phosphatase [Lactococcus sp.]
NAANIAGAQESGLQTIHLQSPQTILDLELGL